MNKRSVIIDCDPGIDDAMALLAAFRAPELDIKAITPVAGNVPLVHTAPNALKILALGGREDIPVYPGADRPLTGQAREASEVHGADGLMGWPMPEPRSVLRDEKAWDVIWREAKALGGELELIATGPLTNLAIALAKYPDLPKYIKKLTVMGGGACFGNATPAAEFNIYADPEAAEMVFRSGMPTALCGLDVCHRAHLTENGGLRHRAGRFLRRPQPAGAVLGRALRHPRRPHARPLRDAVCHCPHPLYRRPLLGGGGARRRSHPGQDRYRRLQRRQAPPQCGPGAGRGPAPLCPAAAGSAEGVRRITSLR